MTGVDPAETDPVDLVVVSSPLQFLNAVEQRAAAGHAPADLLLIGDRHGGGGAVEALLRDGPAWREVLRHGRRPRPSRLAPHLLRDVADAAHRASLERLARGLATRRYRDVVIGDYRNVSQRLVAARVGARGFVLLDDGSVTPQAAAFRADPATAPEPRQFDLGWFRTRLAKRLFGTETPSDPRQVTFFTIYARLLEGAVAPGDRLAENRYDALRARSASRSRGDAVWLLGADHAEAGICGLETYRRVVLGAVAALRAEGRGPIVYRPHRGEAASKVAEIVRAGRLGTHGSTAPVETDYVQSPERPAMAVALASSAVDTLAALDPELELARISLPDGYLLRRADHIRAVIRAHDAFNPRLRVIDPGLDVSPGEPGSA